MNTTVTWIDFLYDAGDLSLALDLHPPPSLTATLDLSTVDDYGPSQLEYSSQVISQLNF